MLPHHPQEDLAKFGYWFQPMFQIGWNLLSKYDNFSVFPPLKMWVIWAIFFKKILCMFCTAFFSFFCVTKWHSFAKKKKFCIMVSVFFRPKFERNCEILCFSIVNLTTLLLIFGEKNYCQIIFLSSQN